MTRITEKHWSRCGPRHERGYLLPALLTDADLVIPPPVRFGPSPRQCWRGHLMTIENAYIGRDGERDCRACRRLSQTRGRRRNPGRFIAWYQRRDAAWHAARRAKRRKKPT